MSSMEQIPLDQLQELYQQALNELRTLKGEFEEFQITSREYDQELEAALEEYRQRETEMQGEQDRMRKENDALEAKCKRMEAEIERTERDAAKWQNKYKLEVTLVEQDNDRLKQKAE